MDQNAGQHHLSESKADEKVPMRGKIEKKITNATSVIMLNCVQPFWIDIWGRTVEKSQTNATDLTFHPLRLASWGYIW